MNPFYWMHDVSTEYLCHMIETDDPDWEVAWDELEDRGYYVEDLLGWW